MRDTLKKLIKVVGSEFNPETPIVSYMYWSNSAYGDIAARLQYHLHECWQHFGMSIYSVSEDIKKELFGDNNVGC